MEFIAIQKWLKHKFNWRKHVEIGVILIYLELTETIWHCRMTCEAPTTFHKGGLQYSRALNENK